MTAGDTQAEEKAFRPVFVVGAQRSGTTLLAALLGRHSALAATPETHFVDTVTPEPFRKASPALSTHDAIRDRVAASPRFWDLGLEKESLFEAFTQAEATYPAFFQLALERYARAAGKPRAVEKTPAHLPHVPILLDWYPRATAVCIVRDGRDSVRSLMNFEWTHSNLRRHCCEWGWCIDAGLRFQKQYPTRFSILRYEDLLEKPEATLQHLMPLLGLDFEAGQLDTSVDAGRVVPGWETDWKKNATAALDTSRIGAWRNDASREETWLMNAAMRRPLEGFGYPDTGLEGCPIRIRIRHRLANALYRSLYHPLTKPHFSRVKRGLESLGIRIGRKYAPEVLADDYRADWLEREGKGKDPTERE